MSIPPRPARWAAPLRRARRRCRGGRRRFQFCIERFQSIGRLFLQLPETGISSFSRLGCPSRARSAAVPDVVGPRLPRPYHFRARIQSFQAVAAPFPGDSRFAVEPSRAAIPASETPLFKRSTIGSAISAGTALGVGQLLPARIFLSNDGPKRRAGDDGFDSRPPPLGWVPLAPSLFQGCRFFRGSNATSFHRQFWQFRIKRLP